MFHGYPIVREAKGDEFPDRKGYSYIWVRISDILDWPGEDGSVAIFTASREV